MMNHAHSPHGACSGHHHGSTNIQRLALVLVLTTLYMIVEFIGGMWTQSLALLADAGHMLADVGAVGLALFAAWFAEHPASAQKTYGYHRLEIFAAFINGVALAMVALYIFYEVVQRLHHPTEIKSGALMLVATGGFLINLVSAAILYTPGQKNINVRGALAHVISDSIGSLGVIVAGALIWFFGFYQADSIFSILIAILVLVNAWKLIGETTNILLEACPIHLSVTDIQESLMALPEVKSVHDLHVWSITSGKEALSAHVMVTDTRHYTVELVSKIQRTLKDKFGLTHLTIQLEPPGFEEDEIHF